jgi:deoxycytidylate deaminase
VYVTMFPCNECAKLLIQAGVAEVVYNEVRLWMLLLCTQVSKIAPMCVWCAL